MKRLFLLLGIVIPVLTSCQNHLGREQAKKMIIETNNYPKPYTYEIAKGFIKDMHSSGLGVTIATGEDEFKDKEQAINQFESIGLLKLTKTPKREESSAFLLGTTIRTWTQVGVSLTETGKKYLIQDKQNTFVVKLWDTNVKEITGIQEFPQLKASEVSYTICHQDITPFGSIFNDRNAISEGTAHFSLYDDGWRME